jgi:hypothetical protein
MTEREFARKVKAANNRARAKKVEEEVTLTDWEVTTVVVNNCEIQMIHSRHF